MMLEATASKNLPSPTGPPIIYDVAMRFPVLLGFLFFTQLAQASAWQELARQGTLFRLQGDFDAAKEVETRLIRDADNPIGHVFAINTIITHMTWDDTRSRYDDAIESHANAVFGWCEPLIDEGRDLGRAHHYCGQASFVMSLRHALAGNYLRAGQYGTRTIEHLESALATEPDLVDAKLHLGVAYYIADNLPPFIKLFSRILWFIPTGNSEKSVPFLLDVMNHGDEFPDVARYIYSALMLNDAARRPDAISKLRELAERYPVNARFQLRLISVLLLDREFEATLAQANRYLAHEPDEPDLFLAQIWIVRAMMGLGRVEDAAQLLNAITPEIQATLPIWSRSWHKLSFAQLNDLLGNRKVAIKAYEDVLDMARISFVNEIIVDAAESGLDTPYSLIR